MVVWCLLTLRDREEIRGHRRHGSAESRGSIDSFIRASVILMGCYRPKDGSSEDADDEDGGSEETMSGWADGVLDELEKAYEGYK